MLDEFLIALGVRADTDELRDFERGLDDVASSAENAEGGIIGAYDATEGFIGAIEGVLGVIGFFTGAIGGLWGAFHGTIMELEELIEDEKLLTKVTKDQLEQSKKYQDSVETLGKRFTSLRVELAFGFLPTMQKMVSAIDSFLEANKDAIVNGVMAFINVALKFFQVLANFGRFINLVVTNTLGWKNTLIALGVALLYVRRAMILAFITNPITWVVAAIAGLLLLIDDFMTYLRGGESEFGEYWGVLIEWINKAKDIWSGFSEEAKSSIKAVMVALGMLLGSKVIISTMAATFGLLGKAIMFVLSPIKMLYGALGILGKAALMVGKAFMVAGRMMLANPAVLIAVAVGVVVYAIIDLIKWIRTGESSFGGFWQACADAWNAIVTVVSDAIGSIIAYVSGMIDSIIAFVSSLIESFVNAWNSVLSTTRSVFSSIGDFIRGIFNSIVNLVTSTVSAIGSAFSSVFSTITAPFGKAYDWIVDKFMKLPQMLNGIVSTLTFGLSDKIGSAVSNVANRTINNVSNTTASIQVNGAGNPQAVANNVQKNINATASRNQGGLAKA